MTQWTDRFHYTTPKDRYIIARLPDGSEATVSWNPNRQGWDDFDGKPCDQWVDWREIEDD
jgi:hypothetical protein